MPKKTKSIPVNNFGGESNSGSVVEFFSFKELPGLDALDQPERHDRHTFFFLEKGWVTMEIDFKKYIIKSPSLIYMHPTQVHRILAFENVTVGSLGMDNESLNPLYLKLLEEITPAKPSLLKKDERSLISEMLNLCLKFSKQNNNTLNHSLVRDSCNTLVAFIISHFTQVSKSSKKLSRFETINKAFSQALELNYLTIKGPAEYAKKLNVSTPYLNECVKNTTGYPVTHHIKQRIILEAKRLLYYSTKSVKEIAFEMGYDNYPYFSRLFSSVTGITPLAFRNKNHE